MQDAAGDALSFALADPDRDRQALLAFNIAYISWIADAVERDFALSLNDMLGMPIPDYVVGALDKLCENRPPQGAFYLVRRGGEPIGMGGLRPLPNGDCEMKRVFVPPTQRGSRLGARIVARLIADARAFGYRRMTLDTGPFMGSAHRLYEASGFRDIPAYPEAEVPVALHARWRFMALDL